MIQFLADNMDQLDLALDQLSFRDRNFDRFALMLIDNVIELTLHQFVKDKASENGLFEKLNKPKYDSNEIQRAIGPNFDNKVKFAAKYSLISNEICESILYIHTYRNTAYHQGLRHEEILHSLAVFHLINACTLLINYKPRIWCWSSKDKLSHRARKYLGDFKLDASEAFQSGFQRLLVVVKCIDEDLVQDLYRDMSETIAYIDRAINFLANDSPQKKTRDQVILDAQAWPFAFTDEAKKFASEYGCKEDSIEGYVNWISKNYDWSIKSDPIPSWTKRLNILKKEKNYHKALKRYCDFLRQTEDIRSKITDSAAKLDAYINHLIDVARGK
jgi:hypothetical protein